MGRFGGVPATEKRTWEASGNGKMDNNEKKNCKYRCLQRIWDVRVLNTLQKNSVLDQLYIEERVNYVVFEEKIETTL